jgi:hypothetical protein
MNWLFALVVFDIALMVFVYAMITASKRQSERWNKDFLQRVADMDAANKNIVRSIVVRRSLGPEIQTSSASH